MGDFWGPLGNETRSWLDFLATGRGGSVHATPEQAMLNLKTTYAIERAVATGQAVRLDSGAFDRQFFSEQPGELS